MCLSYWFHKAKVVTSLLLQLSCSAATWSMLEEEVKFSFQKKTPFRKRLSFVREDLRDNHISNYCELTEGLKTHKTLWISVHTNGSPKHQYATIQDTTITHNGKTCLLSPSCTTCGELTHALHPRNHNTPTVHIQSLSSWDSPPAVQRAPNQLLLKSSWVKMKVSIKQEKRTILMRAPAVREINVLHLFFCFLLFTECELMSVSVASNASELFRMRFQSALAVV